MKRRPTCRISRARRRRRSRSRTRPTAVPWRKMCGSPGAAPAAGMSRTLGYMRELGRSAIDAGADLVLGTHAHVLQGIEFYREGLICYSLNHFAFEHTGHIFPAWAFVHD